MLTKQYFRSKWFHSTTEIPLLIWLYRQFPLDSASRSAFDSLVKPILCLRVLVEIRLSKSSVTKRIYSWQANKTVFLSCASMTWKSWNLNHDTHGVCVITAITCIPLWGLSIIEKHSLIFTDTRMSNYKMSADYLFFSLYFGIYYNTFEVHYKPMSKGLVAIISRPFLCLPLCSFFWFTEIMYLDVAGGGTLLLF